MTAQHPDPWGREPDRALQFSVRALLLVMLIVGVVSGIIGTWGASGLIFVVVGIPFLFLAWVWFTDIVKGRGTTVHLVALLLFLACVSAALLPGVHSGGDPKMEGCASNLKQIALALHGYHQTYGCFPPPYLADATGRPMHSWRVLILPYLRDPEMTKLYQHYRLGEPWNSPHNSQLELPLPKVFRCPAATFKQGRVETSYVALVGSETMWRPGQYTQLNDMIDGVTQTIMLVELADSGIHWMEPRDVPLSEFDDEAEDNWPVIKTSKLHSDHKGYSEAVMADGAVEWLPANLAPEVLRSMLTINGGEDIDMHTLTPRFIPSAPSSGD